MPSLHKSLYICNVFIHYIIGLGNWYYSVAQVGMVFLEKDTMSPLSNGFNGHKHSHKHNTAQVGMVFIE